MSSLSRIRTALGCAAALLLAVAPTAAADEGHGSTPGADHSTQHADHGSAHQMDHGSAHQMDHGSAPGPAGDVWTVVPPDHGDHGDHGTDDTHDTHGQSAAGAADPASQPRAAVLGGFVGVNLAIMAGAAVARRRREGERERRAARRGSVGTSSGNLA